MALPNPTASSPATKHPAAVLPAPASNTPLVDSRPAALLCETGAVTEPCLCGHSRQAHDGHTSTTEQAPPTHCSQGDGCRRFNPAPRYDEVYWRGVAWLDSL